MIVFNVDLDNTIIYSYKHNIGSDKMEVELYNGRNISFITDKTHDMLLKLKDKVLIVPTTTRTVEQYKRINLQIGDIKYALTCNGGVLLVNGLEDETWYKESCRLVKDSIETMLKAISILEIDTRRTFEVRFIKDLFVFTKCDEPESVVNELKEVLDEKLVNVFNNGAKIYVVPKTLSKGMAIKRFSEYIKAEKIIAAGDSEFDISMIKDADIGLAPKGLFEDDNVSDNIRILPGNEVYSEEVLNAVDKLIFR